MDQEKNITTAKQTQWERKLLDLSLRNMLISLRLTKAVVPLLSSNVADLEDALSDGEEFRVLPRPEELPASAGEDRLVEGLRDLGTMAEWIVQEGKHRRLYAVSREKELSDSLTKLYRTARTSMEENGASTLYLVLGLLRWYEKKKDAPVRYAPIVLVPIDIIRKSASKGYAMRMRDEDAQINVTLLAFLKQNFELQFPQLDPPPTDEHGLDLPKVFALIRQEVADLPQWDVVEAGVIGNFSFSQFVMWNDIHSRPEFLEKNKIVRSLIHGAVEWDCAIPDGMDTEEAYLPVTVDSSQLRAINMAAAGVSFVLHGPPGTGKSQTITAMIANALAKGKTVLFVAEKLAALQVVQRRLEALSIQDFCLELHSNKATKKAVLDQLRRGLEIGVWGLRTDYDQRIEDIRRMRAELDSYAKALHVRRPFGKSLRQLIDLYETIPEQEKSLRFSGHAVAALTESDLEHQIQSLERLIAAGREIGHPHHHPLSAVRRREYSQSLKFDLDTVMLSYETALKACRDDVQTFVEQIGLCRPETEKEWKEIHTLAGSVIAAEKIPLFLKDTDSLDREFAAPRAYVQQQADWAGKHASFLAQWNENFLQMDMNLFRGRYEQAHKKLFGKKKALAALTAELQAYASFPVEQDRIPVYLTDISFYQKEKGELEKQEEALSCEWKELLRTYSTAQELEAYQSTIREQLRTVSPWAGQLRKMEAEGTLKNSIRLAERVLESRRSLEQREAEVTALLELELEGERDWLGSRLALCRCILDNAASIKDWIVYRQSAQECREQGLGPVCDAYEAGMPHEELMNVYLASMYRAIILSVIEEEPVLNGFTGAGFQERIAQFKKLDQEFMELTRDELFYRLTHQLPTSYDTVEISRELNLLRRAISSNGRGISIRSLFEQIPQVLMRLCPCMLMSPISAAQYLAAENGLFDIVIFDEASQLPTCKAVGVLARGKNAVIAGDPNQMPPTSFFAGNAVDEDNPELEDLDSILDDCLALGMPQTHLRWHYRSRHESLIAFSNREFYENSMLTFPSVNDREQRVHLIPVEGYFDRGKSRVNEGEARAIVAEIQRRYQDPKLREQSLGVVTFNISQQTLIEDLLQEEFQKDAAFDEWANTRDEALFVKNLENVQGDERDVILFSVAFGPDSEGKLSLNFGPLNRDGGFKRLNVAVSRARMEMVVFSVMRADMLELRRTGAKGVEALKNFLEYAEKGGYPDESVERQIPKDQGILKQICRQLSDAGYRYQTAVGHSGFKVDIAVINPGKEEEYLLGILLDGEAYRQSTHTKDREISQISVLQSLGWQLHRIWTMDWWDNKDKEIGKLLHVLEQEKQKAEKK